MTTTGAGLTGLAKLEAMDSADAPAKARKAAIDSAEALSAAFDLGCQLVELKAAFERFVQEEHLPLLARVSELEGKAKGRNKSSASIRDMTNDDAMEVLVGKYKDMSHKAAEAESNLTYAQIYSCRLEYTFKHVHKQLRDSGWKNPWAKK